MIDIGPRYGVRAYFRDLRVKTRDLAGPVSAEWFERACAATRRPMTQTTIRGMVDEHQQIIEDHGGFGFIESWTTVLGKPACHSTGYLPVAARITNHPADGGAPYDEDVVLIRRLDMEASSSKIAYSMATAHLAITRHALERLYERGRCHQDTFAKTVRDEVMRTLCGIAIAAAADIGHVRPSTPVDYHHHAVPFGSGLMLLDGRLFADWNDPGANRMPLAQHNVIKAGKSVARRPLLSRFNAMVVDHPEAAGRVWASRVFTTRTYIDATDMTKAKTDYLRAFDRLLEEYDFEPLLQTYFRPRPYDDQTAIDIDLPADAMDLLHELADGADDLFNVSRSMPLCSVRDQDADTNRASEKDKAMKYSKGRAGPVSSNVMEIVDVAHLGAGPSAYAKGSALLRKADGSLKDVSFLVQGGNYAALRGRLTPGASVRVPVRWTGGNAVTIVDEKALVDFRKAA